MPDWVVLPPLHLAPPSELHYAGCISHLPVHSKQHGQFSMDKASLSNIKLTLKGVAFSFLFH